MQIVLRTDVKELLLLLEGGMHFVLILHKYEQNEYKALFQYNIIFKNIFVACGLITCTGQWLKKLHINVVDQVDKGLGRKKDPYHWDGVNDNF